MKRGRISFRSRRLHQALAEPSVDPLGPRQLQRRGALHDAVGARCDPHRSHAAFGNESRQLPRTDAVARRLAPHAGHGLGRECDDRPQGLAGAVEVALACQQLHQQRPQIQRLGQRRQPRRARLTLQLKRLRQQPVQTVPVFDSQLALGDAVGNHQQ